MNVSADVETCTAGAIPTPLRVAACGLSLPLSAIVSVAVRGPVTPGKNFKLTLHAEFAGKVSGDRGQLLVCKKSVLFAPVMAILEIVNAPGPLFERVRTMAVLAVPTN